MGPQATDSQFTTHADLFDLSGKCALVTGGNRYIGLHLVFELAQVPYFAMLRQVSTPETVTVDLVEAPGRVAVHRDLQRGSTRVSRGQLDVWTADDPAGSSYQHDVIRFVEGAWRIAASAAPP